MSTPHNQAEMGDIAKTVLMPGDPLRAKFIADTFLSNVVQFNSVRNMFGYTGTYKGKKISVMASGMGIPSISIYSYELYMFYGVERIIRLGSAGAYRADIPIYETVLASAAYSDSTYALMQNGDKDILQIPSKGLNELLAKTADRLKIHYIEGIIHSSDVFYTDERVQPHLDEIIRNYGLCCCEMESFGLFHNAKALGKQAACLLTISDNIVTHEATTAEERRFALVNMIKIALEAIASEDE